MSVEHITVAICRHCYAEDDLVDAAHFDFAGDDSDCSHVPVNGGYYKMVKRRVWMCALPYEPEPENGSVCGAVFKTREEAEACDAHEVRARIRRLDAIAQ